MTALLEWLVIGVGVAFLFGLAIFVHEYGHYRVARWLGLRIEGFSIGFGPRVFSWTDRHGVVWALRWIPLGGFVKLPQMITSEAVEGPSASDVPPITPGAKIAVALAGPAMNVLLAFVLATVVWWVGLPVALNHTVVGYVRPGSPEELAGVREGDRILSVQGKPVGSWEDIQVEAVLALTNMLTLSLERTNGTKASVTVPTEYQADLKLKYLRIGPRDHPAIRQVSAGSPAEAAGLREGDLLVSFDGVQVVGQRQLVDLIQARAGKEALLEVTRGGQTVSLRVTPRLDPDAKVGRIGVVLGPASEPVTVRRIGQFFQALSHPGASRVGVENLNGPVRIFGMLASELKVDPRRALALMVVLNINLALLNLLPLPVLDGGHILFSLVEILTFRRIPRRFHELVTLVSGALLLSLMAFVLLNDIRGLSVPRGAAMRRAATTNEASTNPPSSTAPSR
jgi:regulator of sigma E protease